MTENDKSQDGMERQFRLDGSISAANALVMVYATYPDLRAAEMAGRALVEQKLAGCVNILPAMVSIYVWQEQLESAEEAVLLAKTTAALSEACMRAIHESHPYDTPAVLALPVLAGGHDYLTWIRAGTRDPGKA